MFMSIDSQVSQHNPFYKALKAKSFTDGDITLNFILFDKKFTVFRKNGQILVFSKNASVT